MTKNFKDYVLTPLVAAILFTSYSLVVTYFSQFNLVYLILTFITDFVLVYIAVCLAVLFANILSNYTGVKK